MLLCIQTQVKYKIKKLDKKENTEEFDIKKKRFLKDDLFGHKDIKQSE